VVQGELDIYVYSNSQLNMAEINYLVPFRALLTRISLSKDAPRPKNVSTTIWPGLDFRIAPAAFRQFLVESLFQCSEFKAEEWSRLSAS
jgi:hypothetical protein